MLSPLTQEVQITTSFVPRNNFKPPAPASTTQKHQHEMHSIVRQTTASTILNEHHSHITIHEVLRQSITAVYPSWSANVPVPSSISTYAARIVQTAELFSEKFPAALTSFRPYRNIPTPLECRIHLRLEPQLYRQSPPSRIRLELTHIKTPPFNAAVTSSSLHAQYRGRATCASVASPFTIVRIS